MLSILLTWLHLHADLCCVGVRAWKYWLIKALFSLNHCIPCLTSAEGDTRNRMKQILLNFWCWQTRSDTFFYCRLEDSQQILWIFCLESYEDTFSLTWVCPEMLTVTHIFSVCNYCRILDNKNSLIVLLRLNSRVDFFVDRLIVDHASVVYYWSEISCIRWRYDLLGGLWSVSILHVQPVI